jgi:2-succinyl-5-enolpyruvyl-6-hydroxy-3-cyclohexene-1-carboxylate synthase
MNTTDKYMCRMIARLLAEHGVENVITSPGSRNAPLIVAVAREQRLKVTPVIDERSAAFMAVGMALQTEKPVAVICTSGSALLNYGPAMSEAYYRGLPIIAISADRPINRIDQNDSQTIRQSGALASVVKSSYDIAEEDGHSYAVRKVNDAILRAKSRPCGPVHINVRIAEPLNGMTEADDQDIHAVEQVETSKRLSVNTVNELCTEILESKKVMMLVGFHRNDARFTAAMAKLCHLDNIVLLSESHSNLHFTAPNHIKNIDLALSGMVADEVESLRPELLITMGGSVTSNFVKQYLRGTAGLQHWSVGEQQQVIDTYDAIAKMISMDDADFAEQMAEAVADESPVSDYARSWRIVADRVANRASEYAESSEWSDFKAMGMIMKLLPDCNLHLSNGTAVRYVQLFDYSHISHVECNRGVSGIDGCTSTAIGAAMTTDAMTILITGDMCAQYDLGALATANIPANFKMIVLNNDGGGIFRFIKATRDMAEVEQYLACDVRLPLKQLADGFGFSYYEAAGGDELRDKFAKFVSENQQPAILNVVTDGARSAEILINFYKRKQ